MEPSGRSASAGSIRRSVIRTKELLKRRLRPPPPLPKTNLSASPDGNPMLYDSAARASSPDLGSVPWMRSPQDGNFHHLRRDRYRETPIYSDPGSPLLSRFYFNEEDSCYKPQPTEWGHDEVSIINDYEEVESVDSQSLASFDNSEGLDSPGSDETYATSVASRSSSLSLQCQGQADIDNEAALLERRTSKWSLSMYCEHMGIDEEVESNADEDQQSETGLVYGPSGWSTPTTFHEGTSVCATPLSPAKAHVIDVAKYSPSSSPGSQSSPYSQSLPSTPYWQTFGDCSASGSENETPKLNSSNNLVHSRKSSSHYTDIVRSASSPQKSPVNEPFGSYLQNIYREQASVYEKDVDSRMDLVEEISNSIDNFPQEMLTLDTPCVVELRRRNKNSRALYTAERSARVSSLNRGSSFRRLITKTTDPADSALEIYIPTPTSGPAPPVCCIEAIDTKTANLRPLRTVFPQTDDWWLSLLYAHLVAYNYITSSLAPSLSDNPSSIPPRSSRRKKIPRDSVFGPPPAPLHLKPIESTLVAQNLVEVEDSLASCISCIANFMAGHCDSLYGESLEAQSGTTKSMSDRILVRSLAEVVRGCESS